MDIERAREPFRNLVRIDSDRPGRDDRHHNLIDRLEVAAVAAGIKPAYLGGQSGYNESLLTDIAGIAVRYGLFVRRDVGFNQVSECKAQGNTRVDPGFTEHVWQQWRDQSAAAEQVLWIFADRKVEEKIVSCVRAEITSAEVLGYPTCCTDHFIRCDVEPIALQLDCYAKEYGARTSADYIRLNEEQKPAGPYFQKKIEQHYRRMQAAVGKSLVKFPFIHFMACPRCLAASESPAAQIHSKMRELAHALDASFAREVERYASWYKNVLRDHGLER